MPPVESRVLGGVFGLEAADNVARRIAPPFAGRLVTYLLNARCALFVVCQKLRPKTVWLPSYMCGALLDPFRALGLDVRYYDSQPDSLDCAATWVGQVRATDVVVVIHYFGFPNLTLPSAELASRGAVIIEDASQAFFAGPQYGASRFVVYSPRKFFGVPDGGVLVSVREDDVPNSPLSPPPEEWFERALTVSQMRQDFDRDDGGNRWFVLFREVEETFPLGPFRSSDLTRELLANGIDYESVRMSRRQNYQILAARLAKFALFPDLNEQAVPLGFPVCVEESKRDSILASLYEQHIYPPVHWRLEESVPSRFSDSHTLSRRILTLICDQRYTVSDMERQADAFVAAIN